MSDVGVVLAAAGAGRRFGARKQYLEILGRPLVHYSLDAFAGVSEVGQLVLVVSPDDLSRGEELLRSWRRPPQAESLRVSTVRGGERRQDSVRKGLDALLPEVKFALVHDAARPLVRREDIVRLVEALRAQGAAVLGTPAFDSVKWVVGGEIVEEIPRDQVWTVQTPQGAAVGLLRRAYDAAVGEMTDEASALRAVGARVALVEGSRENMKITRPGDEALAEAILRSRGA